MELRIDTLTAREKEVLTLVIQGYSNKEMAVMMIVSIATVKFHIINIFAKLDAFNRTHAAYIAGCEGFTVTTCEAIKPED